MLRSVGYMAVLLLVSSFTEAKDKKTAADGDDASCTTSGAAGFAWLRRFTGQGNAEAKTLQNALLDMGLDPATGRYRGKALPQTKDLETHKPYDPLRSSLLHIVPPASLNYQLNKHLCAYLAGGRPPEGWFQFEKYGGTYTVQVVPPFRSEALAAQNIDGLRPDAWAGLQDTKEPLAIFASNLTPKGLFFYAAQYEHAERWRQWQTLRSGPQGKEFEAWLVAVYGNNAMPSKGVQTDKANPDDLRFYKAFGFTGILEPLRSFPVLLNDVGLENAALLISQGALEKAELTPETRRCLASIPQGRTVLENGNAITRDGNGLTIHTTFP